MVAADEVERLHSLYQYRIAGTGCEPQFDRIAQLAASLFSTPIAAITFVDGEHVWLKARVGLAACEVPRDIAFCTHVIARDTPLMVADLREDDRFASNPLVRGGPGIRFYAGAPLRVASGQRIGTLCIMDTAPRPALSRAGEAQLTTLASLVVDHLELRRLEFVNAVAHGFANTTHDAVLCIDAQGVITFVNDAARELFDYPHDEMVGQTLDLIMPERFRSAHAAGVARIAAGAPSRLDGKSVELSAMRRGGQEFPIEISISSWRDRHGIHMGASLRDISERKQRDMRLHRLAHQDPLTGLANRLQLEDALNAAYKAGHAVTVLLLDLDRFKTLNDTLGHAVGDALLQTFAVRLQAALDETAIVARLGGDEFAVVLAEEGDPLRVRGWAEAALSTLEAPFRLLGHSVSVGMSVGAAIGPAHGRDGEELIASADLALYRAKADGGTCFRLFDATMCHAVAARRALQDELIRAFEKREFVLHFQPQVRLNTKQLVGAEALLRWRHPDRGLLLPNAFIGILESHTLALDVGHWVLDEACRQLAGWRDAGMAPMRIGVNLFGAQLVSGTLVSTVESVLARYALEPAALEIEITETIALKNDERRLAPLRALRALGVGLAFDDFGTGFASLSTLKRVPLTTLKIDRSFVQGIVDDEQDVAVVAAVVGMGRRLGLDVIAEGIETAEQESRLTSLGCVIGQGFRYGCGMPADTFAQQWHAAAIATARRVSA